MYVSLYDWIVYKWGSKARERKGEEWKHRLKLYTILRSRDRTLPSRNGNLRQFTSAVIISLLILKVVTTVDGVITSAFSSILFNFFYRNYSSNYVIERYREYYGTSC
jgi:hypothetical protein